MAERKPIVYVSGNPQEIADTDRVKNTGITRSGTAPSNPQEKDAWLDLNTGHLKVYSSGAWHFPQYLLNVLEDTSPQLGGSLDVNNQSITSANNGDIVLDPHGTGSIVVGAPFKTTSNGDIDLDPNGSGDVVIKGNSTRGAGAIQLNCEFNSHGIKLKSPPHSANASYTLTFPNDAGTNGYALTTNGSGVLSWTEQVPNGSITSAKLDTNITIAGNLTVNGTTTTVNSTTLTVDDKNIELGSVSTPSDTTADGGGITLKGASDKTITWVNSTDCWTFNQSVNLTAGTASAPALILNGDVNTGFFQSATDEIAVGTAGSERLRIGSSGQIGIAGANYGTSGQVLTSGGPSAAPTWGAVSGSPTFEATADGSISDGAPVIIQTDGTVKAVGEVDTTGTPTVKSRQQFHDDQSRNNCAFYDSGTDKIVNIFRDVNGGQHGTYIVGTFSGSTVSWGSEGTFPNTGSNSQTAEPEFIVAAEVATSKWVIAFTDGNNNNYPTAVVATINSNNTITFGTPVVVDTNYGLVMAMEYDDNAGKVMILYRANSSAPYAIVGTVSGTSISFGSRSVLNDGGWSSNYMHMDYDSYNNKFLAVWSDPNSSTRLEATVLSISSTSVSIDSLTNFTTSAVGGAQPRVVFDPNTNKFVVAFQNSANVGKAYVATISGNNVSIGSEQSLFNDTSVLFDAMYNPDTNEIVFTNFDNSSDGQIRGVKINGTNLTLGSITTFEAEKVPYDISLAYDTSVDKFVATYANLTDNTGNYRVLANSATNLTTTNYIGISDGAYTNGQTATIQVASAVDDAQSGLTPGTIYYVQDSGGIAATASIPSVVAGQAIAATKLLIK